MLILWVHSSGWLLLVRVGAVGTFVLETALSQHKWHKGIPDGLSDLLELDASFEQRLSFCIYWLFALA